MDATSVEEGVAHKEQRINYRRVLRGAGWKHAINRPKIRQVANLPHKIRQVANLPHKIRQVANLPHKIRQVANLPHDGTNADFNC
jgi:hypothetical protein